MKVTVAGNAVVVTSSQTLESLKTIKKYRPSALALMGGEDGKEPVFVIDVADGGCGDINAYGACFADSTHDDAKLACITMCMTGVQGNIQEFVADKLGAALRNLAALEATLPDVLTSVAAEKQAIIDAITVI